MNNLAALQSAFNSRAMAVAGPVKNPSRYKNSTIFRITPQQFARIRVGIQTWREATAEMEFPYYPYRVKINQIYQDTILNEHVESCIEKRKNLTMLRKFKVCDEKGEVSEELTKLFQATWFNHFQSYCLDAIFHGYNLISLGDLIDGEYNDISFMQRQNISPERRCFTSVPYMSYGEQWEDPKFKPWYIWVPTPTKVGGYKKCGYGLLHTVAKTEILLRNNTGQNADYNELFGQPIRKGTTSKQGDERQAFADSIQGMGSSAWIIMDEMDKLELVDAPSNGRAFETYKDFEKRGENKITKIILLHEDALSSTPGKLGGTQGGDQSPQEKALMAVQVKDGDFMQPIINKELIPRMREHGFDIPLNYHFEYLNDDEKEEFRQREDESNTKTATLFKTIKDAGGKLDEEAWKYFEERTGIPVKMADPIEVAPPFGGAPGEKPPMNGVPKPGDPKEKEEKKEEKIAEEK